MIHDMRSILPYALILLAGEGCQPQPPEPTVPIGSDRFIVPDAQNLEKLDNSWHEFGESTSMKDGQWLLVYAFNGDALSYAVIEGPGHGVVHSHCISGINTEGKHTAVVDKPDGTKISIADSGRIIFLCGTNFAECPQQISGKTFSAFLNSQPSDYTMAALLAFKDKHK